MFVDQIPTYRPSQDPETWDGTYISVSELMEDNPTGGEPMAKRSSAAAPLYDLARAAGRTATAIRDMEDIMRGDFASIIRRKARREMLKAQRKMTNSLMSTSRKPSRTHADADAGNPSSVSAETQAQASASTPNPERQR